MRVAGKVSETSFACVIIAVLKLVITTVGLTKIFLTISN